jgi:hypothetical protein
MAKELPYAALIIMAIVLGAALILGGIAIMNSIALQPYYNLLLVTVALTMGIAGALLLFSSLYSVVTGIFRIEKNIHEHEHAGHETKQ